MGLAWPCVSSVADECGREEGAYEGIGWRR